MPAVVNYRLHLVHELLVVHHLFLPRLSEGTSGTLCFKKLLPKICNLSKPAMREPFTYDISQWIKSGESSSEKCRRLTASSYVGASTGLEAVSTPVETQTYTDVFGKVVHVPVNQLGECSAILSVFQYYIQYPSCLMQADFFTKCAPTVISLTCESAVTLD